MPPPDTGAAPAAPLSALFEQFGALLGELPGLFSDRIELLSLEMQRAAAALAQIAALALVIGILGVSVWLLIWAALIVALLHAGLALVWALLLALLLNLAGACWAAARIRSLLPRVSLPATRRHLLFSAAPSEPAAATAKADIA